MQLENKQGDTTNLANSLNEKMGMSCDTDFSSQLFPKRANQTTNPILKPSSASSPAPVSNPFITKTPTTTAANEPTVIPSSQIHKTEPIENKEKVNRNTMIVGIVVLVVVLIVVFMIIVW